MTDNDTLPKTKGSYPFGVRTSPRELLERLGVEPSKARGQNFLHDSGVIRRIADLAVTHQDHLIVEIGPGLGALTAELDRHDVNLIAVEVDPRLADHLRQLPFSERVRIVNADALTLDSNQLTGGRPFTLVGNLPYSIATAILEHFLDQPWLPGRVVVMVQREVAQRMVASPPEMSVLSVAMQFYGQPKIAMRVGSGAFIPAPTIESSVITMDIAPAETLAVAQRQRLFRLVRSGFSQRRKRLDNALAASLRHPKPEIETIVCSAGIDGSRRAETLTVADWLKLYHAFETLLDADG